ncbi:MAG TPA: hypothetical protein VF753_03610 [Terriglobales bacterium]
MDSDFVYSCLMDSTWFFLIGWLVVLVGAGVWAFRYSPAASAAAQSLHRPR